MKKKYLLKKTMNFCGSISKSTTLKNVFIGLSACTLSLNASAQNKPFPQQIDFQNCIKPSNASQAQLNADVANFYEIWKSQYLKPTNMPGGYYVEGECTGCTEPAKGISEGHGWGMLITALMAGYDADAKTYFDGFYNYFDQHRSPYNDELMSWMIEFSENGGEHSATDGDLDIAYSLLLAHDQWGSNGAINYLQEAQDMITDGLKVSDMNQSSFRVMRGTWDTDPYTTRSSDWMTAQFRAYQEATNDNFWNSAINTAYDLMFTIQDDYSQSTGLMPDFVVGANPTPAPPFELESVNDGSFNWNACRFPWRVAMDYAHYGNNDAKVVVSKIVDWAKAETNGNPSSFKAGYTLDGSPLVEYSSNAFISPLIVASIVDSSHQSFLNSGWDYIKDSYYSYYDASINLLSMLVISGNWWVPLQEDVISTPENELTVSSINEFSANGGSQTITVSSNINWSVVENSSWVSVNTTSGNNNGSVGVTAAENTSTTSRSANITISGGGISRSVNISQAAAEDNSNPGNNNYVEIPSLLEAENYVSQEGIQLEDTNDNGGGENVGWIDEGDSLAYNIAVPNTGSYTIDFRLASRALGINFDIYQGNSLIGSISSSATGGWQSWETVSTSVNLTSGNQTITLSATEGGWNINWLEFSTSGNGGGTVDPPSTGCNGVAEWDPNTTYGEEGTQVVFEGNIYENKWYTLNQSPADFSANSWDLWTLLGACTSNKNVTIANSANFNVFPNPFTDQINVNTVNSIQAVESLQLVDLSGKLIAVKTITGSEDSLNNLGQLSNGLYLLQALNAEGQVIAVKKIIK